MMAAIPVSLPFACISPRAKICALASRQFDPFSISPADPPRTFYHEKKLAEAGPVLADCSAGTEAHAVDVSFALALA